MLMGAVQPAERRQRRGYRERRGRTGAVSRQSPHL